MPFCNSSTRALRSTAVRPLAVARPAPKAAKSQATPKTCPAWARVEPGTFERAPDTFDELVDPSGCVRPPYRAIWPLVKRMTAEEKDAAALASRKHFDNEYEIHPVPRMLTRGEWQELRDGVAQRATAIRAFLEDHHSGAKRYASVVSTEEVDRLIERQGESQYAGEVDASRIAFWYGPDIMRRPDGRFTIIEDNLGYIGGPEDLVEAHEALYDVVPSYAEVLPRPKGCDQFFRDLVEQAKSLARPEGGKVVWYTRFHDADSRRTSAHFEPLGIETLDPYAVRQLRCDKDGAWVTSTDEKSGTFSLERVGFIFIRGEHSWLGLPGYMDALRAGTVATQYSPGIDFVTNKDLKHKIDELIPFYLGEEPILPSIPTTRFTEEGAIERHFRGEAYKDYVFKAVDGRAGYGVEIGPKMSQQDADRLREVIQQSPDHYIAEPYMRMSTLDGNLVDLRVIAAVGPDAVHVAPTFWGRGAPIGGSGKVNVHQGARVTPVLVAPDGVRESERSATDRGRQ